MPSISATSRGENATLATVLESDNGTPYMTAHHVPLVCIATSRWRFPYPAKTVPDIRLCVKLPHPIRLTFISQ
jgi:hypothetical protein